jgi:hypothetical protein
VRLSVDVGAVESLVCVRVWGLILYAYECVCVCVRVRVWFILLYDSMAYLGTGFMVCFFLLLFLFDGWAGTDML